MAVYEAWVVSCSYCRYKDAGFAGEADALRAEIAHLDDPADCPTPLDDAGQLELAAKRDRLAALAETAGGETAITAYEMNPAEDTLMYGDELREGMWVLREDRMMRYPGGGSEDQQIRMNRFCRVTRLRTTDAGHGPCAAFIGEWVDGYQKAFEVNHRFAWIVKRDRPVEPEVPEGDR